jgi:cyclopropane fatty-acyl-phospholipid synthase-like methyltransferase
MSSIADTDKMMYECGLEVLHPGGIEKTDEMARACGVGPATKVLDIGGGRGTTACHLARNYGCKVLGIDVSPDMVEAARQRVREEGLEHLVDFRQADAHDLPFEDESFDVVLIECVTTLLDRDRAFREFRRVLKKGGYLGDLEMTYQREPAEEFVRQLYDDWDGFTTMTFAGWEGFLRNQGLEVVKVDDFSKRLANMRRVFVKELGIVGMARMAWKLLRQPDIARGMMAWDQVFKQGEGVFGYGYFVARKAHGT